MTSACDAEAIDPPVARRTTYTLVLAAAILLPLALATDDSAEHGTPLVVLALAGGFLAFVYFPPIALTQRRGTPGRDVAVAAIAILAGHAIAALIAAGPAPLLGYLGTSAAATWWLLRSRGAQSLRFPPSGRPPTT